jgi:hypothetical protein
MVFRSGTDWFSAGLLSWVMNTLARPLGRASPGSLFAHPAVGGTDALRIPRASALRPVKDPR